MKVFISGIEYLINSEISCSVQSWVLPPEVRICLDELMEKGDEILIGDEEGTDERVQEYLNKAHYTNVTVYVTGSKRSTRHNIGHWEERHFRPGGQTGYSMWMEKDFRMAEDADTGIAIWDGAYKGTFINMLYLLAQNKSCRMFHIKENRWIDICTLKDLGQYRGSDGEIGDNEVRLVMEACGFSKEMIDYSVSERTVSPYMLVDIVCRAPVNLDRKIYLLSVLTKSRNIKYEVYESVLDNIKKNSPLKAIKHDIRAYADYRSKESIWMHIWNCYKEITTAQEEMYESSGDMTHDRPLYLFTEWYDTDMLSYKSEPCGLFVMPETVSNYIKNEEMDDETGEGCYRMECWDDYDIHWENERYDYLYYKGEVCWFQKMIPHKEDNGNTYYRPEKRRFTSGDRDLNLKTPYKPGDIVLIDCRPFGPPFWAMILEARHQYDCCFPNILFCIPGMDHTDPASKVWRIISLKHRLFYKEGKYGSYAPMLSPLYRIRQINEDDLTGDEPTYINTLIRCGKELKGSEEKAAYIWNTWRERGLDDMTKDELIDLFNTTASDE